MKVVVDPVTGLPTIVNALSDIPGGSSASPVNNLGPFTTDDLTEGSTNLYSQWGIDSSTFITPKDSSYLLLIGNTPNADFSNFFNGPKAVFNTDTGISFFVNHTSGSGGFAFGSLFAGARTRGTMASPTTVQAGDLITGFVGIAYETGNGYVAGNGTDALPGFYIQAATTASGGGLETNLYIGGITTPYLTARTGTGIIFNQPAITASTASVGLILRGLGSQTANLQEWQDSSSTTLAAISPDGRMLVGDGAAGGIRFGSASGANIYQASNNLQINTASSGFLYLRGASAGIIYLGADTDSSNIQLRRYTQISSNNDALKLAVKAAAGQTANIQEWQNSSGTALASITSGGVLNFQAAVGDKVNWYPAAQAYKSGVAASVLWHDVPSAARHEFRHAGTRTVAIDSTGINFGTAGDTNLYRSTANVLKTDDSFIVGSDLTTQGGRTKNTTRVTTTYTVLTSDEVVFGNTDSAGYTATLPAGAEGQQITVINSGSSGNTLTVAVQSGEDIYGVTNGTHLLSDGESAILTYNATDGWY